ncbi:uncharacterized protein RB166_014913 [Leptodactylus fuscus]
MGTCVAVGWRAIALPVELYQPVDLIYVRANTTAKISCVSSQSLEGGTLITWYHRSWTSGGNISLVKSCGLDNNRNKYVCSNDDHKATLQIRNTQSNDSGTYFCTYYSHHIYIGNGTALIVQGEDQSTSKTSIHLFVPPLTRPRDRLLLACVAHEVGHNVPITWNISGTFHKISMTSIQRADTTWTFMSIISLSRKSLTSGNRVTCEVRFNSSTPVVVHWQTPGKIKKHSRDKNMSQDEITYAQLNMSYLNERRK